MIGTLMRCGVCLATISLTSSAPAYSFYQPSQQQDPPKEQKKDQKKDQADKKGQPAGKDNPQNNPPGGTPATPTASDPAKPAPLFGGTLNLKSSRQTKDSSALGFNGVDPNGQVQKSFLSAAPTGADAAKAQQVAVYKVDQAELAAFIADGHLNPKAAPQKPETK
ncbi:MAG TPA: hypothetical protein VOA64_21315 [Candidatus Dormibacteraeota bacterium]|nr:hypothetical protein [Candidatus Dormibacteraeota bacterium]